MKITIKRIKEKYRENPLWIATIFVDDSKEEIVDKSLLNLLRALQARTDIFES